jgi:hypothetical protein
MMDQNGRGKGDLVTVADGTHPINAVNGTPFSHAAIEPCYWWNNVHLATGHALGFDTHVGQPTTKAGIDYFNLGRGFPADSTPLAVSTRYTAALNGVAYTGTFVYPHPLVTAQPLVAAQPTSTQCSRLQRRLDRLERRQQRLEQRHRSKPPARQTHTSTPTPTPTLPLTPTPTPSPSLLDASGYLVHKCHFVSLTWSGALGTLVNVYRDGVLISMQQTMRNT